MKRNLLRLLCVLAAIIYPHMANCETAARAWVRQYSQVVDSTDQAARIATDSAGNVIVAGWTDDAVNGPDILVIKYSAAGVPLWTNRYNGPGAGSDYVAAIAVDAGGNVVVAGSSFGGNSGSDFVTLKYSSTGVPMWTNRYDGPASDSDWVSAMVLDSSGNVYVTGASYGIGTGEDFVTIKYSSAGTLLWSNRYNGTGNGDDQPYAIALDANGNAYVTGGGALVTPYDYDFLTVAYSSAGAFLWAKSYNGPSDSDDIAQAIAVSGTNVFVTGSSYSTNTFDDYLTIAYSTAGVALWTNRYNGPRNDSDQPCAIATFGTNVFVTGYSQSDLSASYDYTTIAYTTTGVPLWTNRYNGTGSASDQPVAMTLDGSGNLFVTGSSYGGSGTAQDYATVALSSGGMVLWITRYNGPGNDSDSANAVATDSVGNVFVTGASRSATSDDWATIKYSSLGVAQWTNRYNGVAKSSGDAQAVAIDGGGNVYVTGNSRGNGTGSDYATIKYSATGTALWTNRFASSGAYLDDDANAIAVDASGNVFVTGNASTTNTVDRLTIAYSSGGAPLWTNRYEEAASWPSYAQAIAVSAGKVYVTGWGYNTNGDSDYLTIALSTAGVPLWTNRYSGLTNGYDQTVALAADASGNVAVTGYSDGANSQDFATIKYSSSGVPLWTNRYDGAANGDDQAQAVAMDAGGNVYVTGYSYGTNSQDIATIKYSSAGVALWTNRFDGPFNGDDSPSSIAVDGSGNVFVTGFAFSGSEYDFVTIAYSSAGSGLWTNYYSGFPTYDSQAQAVAVDGSGRVFVTGYSASPTSSDFATIAYSTNGVALWTNRFGGPGNNNGPLSSRSIAVPANGSVVVVGDASVGSHVDFAVIKYVTLPEARGIQFGIPGPKMSTVTLAGAATNQYVVQFATNLATNLWFNLSTNAAGANGLWNVVDGTATNSQRFYRALIR